MKAIPEPKHNQPPPPPRGAGLWGCLAHKMNAPGDYYGPDVLPTKTDRNKLMRAMQARREREPGLRYTSRKIDGQGYGVWRLA